MPDMMSERSTDYDAVLDLCRAKPRRVVLAALGGDRSLLTLDDLAEAVIEHNHGTSISEASDALVEEVRVHLHHVHLPELAERGIVEYDPERHVVEPMERFEELRYHIASILEADPELEPTIAL